MFGSSKCLAAKIITILIYILQKRWLLQKCVQRNQIGY